MEKTRRQHSHPMEMRILKNINFSSLGSTLKNIKIPDTFTWSLPPPPSPPSPPPPASASSSLLFFLLSPFVNVSYLFNYPPAGYKYLIKHSAARVPLIIITIFISKSFKSNRNHLLHLPPPPSLQLRWINSIEFDRQTIQLPCDLTPPLPAGPSPSSRDKDRRR